MGVDGGRRNSRAALVEAAFEEFTQHGYEATTVAGIAERAGVTTGALYAHFTGKLGLLLATLGLAPVEEILRSAREAAALPRREASERLVESMSRRPDRHMLLLLDVIVVARRDPHVAQILRRGLEAYVRASASANGEAVALGLLDPAVSPDDLARILTLLRMGMIVFGALDGTPPSGPAFARLVELVLRPADDGGEQADGDGADDAGDEPAELARVRARATAAERARRELHDGIVEAVREGHSLRRVGAAAGLSHEHVRKVLRSHDGDGDGDAG